MKNRSQTVKGQLFAAFFTFTAAILFIAVVSYININRANSASERDKVINGLKIKFLELANIDRDFFDFESMNSNFYQSKESSLLTKRDFLYHQIRNDISNLVRAENATENIDLEEKLKEIDIALQEYSLLMASVTEKIYQRGFRDEGLEGKMRDYAHRIERYKSEIPTRSLLQLRRHEKDYFLRNDSMYVVSFNKLIDSLRLSLRNKPQVESLLLNYKKLFNRIVDLEYEIGFSDNTGRKKDLFEQRSMIDLQFAELFEISNEQLASINKKSRLYIYTTIAFSVISAIFLSILIARKIGRPLEHLSSAMNEYSKKEPFSYTPTRSDIYEIQHLENSFFDLMEKTRKQLKEIKETNSELKKVNNELDLFVYSTAHDLKAPLSSILGLIEVMRMETKSDSMNGYLKMMESSIHKLNDFIKDIVDYGKNSRLELLKEEVNLKEIIDDIFNNYKYLEKFDKIEVRINFENDIPLVSDPKRIHIILRNLISNSIRYADIMKESPFVEVQVFGSNNMFQISIIDNAIGISEEHHEKLFDMFYRASPDSKGSGIGLFIVKETIEKMGGTVSFKSTLGSGTTFNIAIPNHLENTKLSDSRLIKEGYTIQ